MGLIQQTEGDATSLGSKRFPCGNWQYSFQVSFFPDFFFNHYVLREEKISFYGLIFNKTQILAEAMGLPMICVT